jgi:hypothetical protein
VPLRHLPQTIQNVLPDQVGTTITLNAMLSQIIRSGKDCIWFDFSRARRHRANALADWCDRLQLQLFRTPAVIAHEMLPRPPRSDAARYIDHVSLHFESMSDALDNVLDNLMIDALATYSDLMRAAAIPSGSTFIIIDEPSSIALNDVRLQIQIDFLRNLDVPCLVLLNDQIRHQATAWTQRAGVLTCTNDGDSAESVFR